MNRVREWWKRAAGMFHKERRDAELAEELAAHLEMLVEENVERGMTPEEARRAARIALGGGEQIKEAVREQRGLPWIESFVADVRFGLRMLRKNPGFTATAVLTLAIGIGANTAVFSVVDWLMFRPLPISGPNQIAMVLASRKSIGTSRNFSYPDLRLIQEQTPGAFTGMAAVNLINLDGLSFEGTSQPMLASYVTGNFFELLGVKPALGRLILPAEGNVEGADPVVAISYSYWKSRFDSDPSIIGKPAGINGHPVTIIGVAPEGFHGLTNAIDTQGYMPVGMMSTLKDAPVGTLGDAKATRFTLIARLKAGVSLMQAQSPLAVAAREFSKERNAPIGLRAVPIGPTSLTISPANPGIVTLVSSLFLILPLALLILTCLNIGNLLIARAATRQREMALRAALGASRGRLIRQLLTESFLLAGFGCAGGILLGLAAARSIGSISLGTVLPIVFDFRFDWRVFTYGIGAAGLTAILVGAMPALRACRADVNDIVHDGGRGSIGSRQPLRRLVTVAQIGGSLMLLIVAGLFVRSLENVQHTDLGFDPSHLLNVTVDTHEAGYDENQTRDFQRILLERANALPGIKSASLAFSVPMSYTSDDRNFTSVEGYTPPPGQRLPLAGINRVSPGYFATMRIPLLEGRDFRDSDNQNSQRVAIVNQSFVARYWHGQDAIGRHLTIAGDPKHSVEVVGVAKNSRDADLFTENDPFFYVPLAQNYDPITTLQLRTSLAPKVFANEVLELIHSLDPAVPVFDVQPMTTTIDGINGLLLFRVAAALATSLGLIGLILAIIGVYGVISYSAGQRTNEIGVRIALGAYPAQILKLVLGQALVIIGVGVIAGIAFAAAISRLFSSLLVGVAGFDALTYAAASIILAAAAVFACYAPARRAMRVDPMVALRHE